MSEYDDNQDAVYDDGFDEQRAIDQSGETTAGKRPFGERLKGAVSGSGRALLVIIVTVLGAIALGSYLVVSALSANAPQPKADMERAPSGEDSAPTAEDATPRYAEITREANGRRADQAMDSGESSVPTLISEREQQTPPAQPQPFASDDCGPACEQRLRDRLNDARQATAEARADVNQLRDEFREFRRASEQENTVKPSRYRYKGSLYMDADAEAQRRERMRAEMQQIASVTAAPETHGYAEVQTGSPEGGASNASEARSPDANATSADDELTPADSAAPSSQQTAANPGATLIAAAKTLYATLDMTANSDVPGAIRATIHQGEYAGARVLGEFTKRSDYLVLQFTSMTTKAGKTYAIDAVAVDTQTRMTGMADEVDTHLFSKLAAVGGAAFLQGFGESVQRAGTNITINTDTGTIATGNDALESTGSKALAALGRVGQAAGDVLRPYAQRPTTVIKYANTGMALLFAEPVTTSDAVNG